MVFWYGVLLTIFLWYVFVYTALGRRLLFVGRGRNVSRLSGINVGRVRWGALIGSGFDRLDRRRLLHRLARRRRPDLGPVVPAAGLRRGVPGATAITPGPLQPDRHVRRGVLPGQRDHRPAAAGRGQLRPAALLRWRADPGGRPVADRAAQGHQGRGRGQHRPDARRPTQEDTMSLKLGSRRRRARSRTCCSCRRRPGTAHDREGAVDPGGPVARACMAGVRAGVRDARRGAGRPVAHPARVDRRHEHDPRGEGRGRGPAHHGRPRADPPSGAGVDARSAVRVDGHDQARPARAAVADARRPGADERDRRGHRPSSTRTRCAPRSRTCSTPGRSR